MISCFVDALRVATTKKNCFSSFRKSGIFPVNMEEPLSSHYIVSNAPERIKERVKESNHGSQGVITDDIYLQNLVEQSDQSFEEDRSCLDMLIIAEDLIMGPKKYGRIISPLKPFNEVTAIEKDDNRSLKKGFTRRSLSVQTYFD